MKKTGLYMTFLIFPNGKEDSVLSIFILQTKNQNQRNLVMFQGHTTKPELQPKPPDYILLSYPNPASYFLFRQPHH